MFVCKMCSVANLPNLPAFLEEDKRTCIFVNEPVCSQIFFNTGGAVKPYFTASKDKHLLCCSAHCRKMDGNASLVNKKQTEGCIIFR